uniref:MARVEL domain-containing protein n=1 Tax=Plectus sambesii TaxID=2011161 RepID=A0A914VJB2_9BILA
MVPLFNENITSSPGFFVFTGIVSLLFVLGILVVYLFFWGLYESNNLFAMIDFGVTALLTLFWFIGTICWWAGASAVGEETSEESIIKLLTIDNACHNDKPQCTVAKEGGYGSLVISVFAGWACVLLFAANCWFIFKETIWFRNRQSPPTISSPTTGVAQTQQQGGYHA